MESVTTDVKVNDCTSNDEVIFVNNHELQRHLEHLKSTRKIEHVALIDFSGNLLVKSHGFNINPDNTQGVIHVLNSSCKTLVKIRIGKKDFVCFRNSTSSFVGKSNEDFVCAYRSTNFVVICTADPESPGSCIYEVSRYVRKCFRNSVLSLQSQRNSLALEAIDVLNLESHGSNAALETNGV